MLVVNDVTNDDVLDTDDRTDANKLDTQEDE